MAGGNKRGSFAASVQIPPPYCPRHFAGKFSVPALRESSPECKMPMPTLARLSFFLSYLTTQGAPPSRAGDSHMLTVPRTGGMCQGLCESSGVVFSVGSGSGQQS